MLDCLPCPCSGSSAQPAAPGLPYTPVDMQLRLSIGYKQSVKGSGLNKALGKVSGADVFTGIY